MRVELERHQVATLLEGLDAMIEAAESENGATGDTEIHESNGAKIAEAEAVRDYLSGYEDRQKTFFKFSDRLKLAEMFKIWAAKNKVKDSADGVIAFLQASHLLDIEAAKEHINAGYEKFVTDGDHVFELVDSVLPGYEIWNIGSHMVDGYLPLCRLKSVQPFPGGCEIEVDTLKAIKCDGAQVILAAVGYGPDTPDEMEKFITKHSKSGRHTEAVKRMREALPYMRRIEWS